MAVPVSELRRGGRKQKNGGWIFVKEKGTSCAGNQWGAARKSSKVSRECLESDLDED